MSEVGPKGNAGKPEAVAGSGGPAGLNSDAKSPAGTDRRARAEASELDDGQQQARDIALRQLTVRARSRVELERALARKQVAPGDAAQVLDRLSEVGLVDDADFAAQWIATGARRGRGRGALRAELVTKGVDREVIAETLDSLDDDHDLKVALAFAERKAAQLRAHPHPVRYRRLAGALARRGFAPSVVAEVTRRVLADLPEPPSDLAD